MKIDIGTIVHIVNRQRVYILIVLVCLPWVPRIISKPTLLLWLLILIPLFLVSIYVDIKWIMGKEWGYIFRKNKEWRELKEDIKEIKKKLEAK